VIELIEKIIIYKFPKKSRKELERMFNLTDWRKTRFYREVKEEGREEGREEGKLETVPLLVRLGLSAEQISVELGLDIAAVRQAMNENKDSN
jgi:predicted transposase/invertase (TIGR01784 family)